MSKKISEAFIANPRTVADGTEQLPINDGTAAPAALLASTLKAYVNLGTPAALTTDTDGTLAANSDAKIATQKATKTYTDTKVAAAVAGLSWKQAVRAASTANGTLATAFENGDTLDGVTLATGDRILLKNQTAPAENGIYIVAASGAPTRATDADTGAELVDASVLVAEGSTLADTQWTCTTNAPITIGVTSLTWAQFSAGSGTVTASGGSLTANALVLGAGTTDTKVVAGITTDGTSKLNLGVAGASVGAVALANATSGTITVQPPTGALGSVTVTIPAATDTLANLAGAQAFTNKTYNGNIWTAGTMTLTGASGKTLTVSNSLTLAGTDGTTMTFPPASASVGYLGIPQNSQSTAYTTVLADAGKCIYHPASDANARTFTIDSNANVAYPVGTAISFQNRTSQVVSIAITSDTMTLGGTATTGTRSLANNGFATAVKDTSTGWLIWGVGLT